jgi:replicative DNA helicase
MDSERAILTSALNSGQVATLLARGVEGKHFSETASGNECREVFEFSIAHSRKYAVSPSPQLIKNNFPNWRGEPSSDPLEALIDEFKKNVGRRIYARKVIELAQAEKDPSNWGRLDEIMLDVARDLATVFPSGQVSRVRAEMQERIDQYEIDKQEGISTGIKMGIPLFDDLTDGFQPGDVATVAGFSGKGKSSLSGWMLANVLNQEKTGLLLSLEMSRKQILERFDTMIMNFSHKLLRKRELPNDKVNQWRDVAKKYENTKNDLIVADKLGQCTVDRVYAEINRYKPDVTCVDYVQLMRGSKASMSKWEGLVEITNELKAIALSTDSTIIMVSQDQRGSAEDGSTERNMGGSISVLQAADLYIGMMQNEEMRLQNKMEVRLIKNRNGAPAETSLLWEPEIMRFRPWEDKNYMETFIKNV